MRLWVRSEWLIHWVCREQACSVKSQNQHVTELHDIATYQFLVSNHLAILPHQILWFVVHTHSVMHGKRCQFPGLQVRDSCSWIAALLYTLKKIRCDASFPVGTLDVHLSMVLMPWVMGAWAHALFCNPLSNHQPVWTLDVHWSMVLMPWANGWAHALLYDLLSNH